MYPVTGASGGAMRSPWPKIPAQFVIREPCHNNILVIKENILSNIFVMKKVFKKVILDTNLNITCQTSLSNIFILEMN